MGGMGYSAAGKAADGVSSFDALSLEARIGIIIGIVVFALLVGLAILYLKRKHATYDRNDDGGGGLHPEVVMQRDRKLTTGRGAVAGRSARDLEAQFVNYTAPSMPKKPLMRPVPMAAAREYRPRPRREKSQGESTLMAGRGDT